MNDGTLIAKKSSCNRNLSLDVLRCLLIYGVVLTHTLAFCQYGERLPWCAVADCLTHPAVDGFAALSGWFGVRCSCKKLFRLVSIIFFCGTLCWLLHLGAERLLGACYLEKFGFQIPHWGWCYERYRFWYLGAYAKLLVASILLNPVLTWISQLKKYWIALIAAVVIGGSYLSTLWFPWVSHSPRTIIFVYVVVRFALMFGLKEKVQESVVCHRIVGGLFLACLCVLALNAKGWLPWHFNSGNYANPVVILTGVLAVAWFSALKLPANALVRFCGYAAPSVIAIYMVHTGMTHSSFVPLPKLLMDVCHFPQELAFMSCALMLVLICLGVDSVRRLVLGKIKPWCSRNRVGQWLLG